MQNSACVSVCVCVLQNIGNLRGVFRGAEQNLQSRTLLPSVRLYHSRSSLLQYPSDYESWQKLQVWEGQSNCMSHTKQSTSWWILSWQKRVLIKLNCILNIMQSSNISVQTRTHSRLYEQYDWADLYINGHWTHLFTQEHWTHLYTH